MVFLDSRLFDDSLAPKPDDCSLDESETEKAVSNELVSKTRMSNINRIRDVTPESISLHAIIEDVETPILLPKPLIQSSNDMPSLTLMSNAKGKGSINEAMNKNEPADSVRIFPELNSKILFPEKLNNKQEKGRATKSHIKLKSLVSSISQLLSLNRFHEEHFVEEDQTKRRLKTRVRTLAQVLPHIRARESSCRVDKPSDTESNSCVVNTVAHDTQIKETIQAQTVCPSKTPHRGLAQNPMYGTNFLNSSTTSLCNLSKKLFDKESEKDQNGCDSNRSMFHISTKKRDPQWKFQDERKCDSVLSMSEPNPTSRPVMSFFNKEGNCFNNSSIRNFSDELHEENSKFANEVTWKIQKQNRQLKFLSNPKDPSSFSSDVSTVTQISLERQVHVPQKRTSTSSTSSTGSVSTVTALFSSLILVKLGGQKKRNETEMDGLSPYTHVSMTPSMVNLRPNADMLEAPIIKDATDAVPSLSFFSGAITSLSNMVFDTEAEHILKLEHVEKLLQRGNEHDDAGRHKKALTYYNKVLSYQRDIHGKDHLETAKCLNIIGVSQTKLGNLMLALTAFEEALHIRQEILGRKHDDVRETTLNINRVVAEANKGTYSAQMILDQINDASAPARQPISSTDKLSNLVFEC